MKVGSRSGNWAVCPKCKNLERRRIEELSKSIDAAYGRVSQGEYLQLKSRLDTYTIDEELTLRESYTQGVDEDGRYVVSYKCSCPRCGYKFSYEYVQDTDVT